MSQHCEDAKGLDHQPDSVTQEYVFSQTMMRIKDPERSLAFYSKVLGMSLIRKFDFPDMQFSLYFLGMVKDKQDIPSDKSTRATWLFKQPAMLELTHNWGSENDKDFEYHNGNDQPQGFGHIGFTVPDVYAACERFQQLGVSFVKEVDAGKMQGLAFIRDPDGYWIEILQADMLEQRGQDWGLAE